MEPVRALFSKVLVFQGAVRAVSLFADGTMRVSSDGLTNEQDVVPLMSMEDTAAVVYWDVVVHGALCPAWGVRDPDGSVDIWCRDKNGDTKLVAYFPAPEYPVPSDVAIGRPATAEEIELLRGKFRAAGEVLAAADGHPVAADLGDGFALEPGGYQPEPEAGSEPEPAVQ